MQTTNKLGILVEDDTKFLGFDCHSLYSHSSRQRRSRSASGVHEDILNKSPRLSHHNPNIHLERRLHEQNSLYFQERMSEHSSTTSITSTEIPVPKPAPDLIKEIAGLELEVIHLEQYLLSLYRTAFDQYLASSPTVSDRPLCPSSECCTGPLVQDAKTQIAHQATRAVNFGQLSPSINSCDDKISQSDSFENKEKKRAFECQQIDDYPAHDLAACYERSGCPPREKPEDGHSKSVSGRRSLADHLGASLKDHILETPCKLSEDILRCISAIYCKLSNPPTPQIDLFASPTTSLSSSSTFSPKDPCDNWSPQCHYETTATPCRLELLKDKHGPYSGMVEVPMINVDGAKFQYASTMLQIFRSLIQRLETVDPGKMEHEEKLAFWINIHNALVMHAFLAYGLHQNHMKSTSSILKAAYNVGGHSINAYVIQSSIIGCQPHRPALWLRALFSPAKKFMAGNDKHAYALDHPEPLVHFALCLGAHSDPAVRVYTAKRIFKELKIAKDEFVQANVSVQKETKIILPKILYYYAKDASLQLPDLVKSVRDSMPEAQQKAIEECLKGRLDKCIEWSPYKSSFRYIVHRDLAKQ